MAVGHESGHQMDQEVERAAMVGMLDLTDALEFVHEGIGGRLLAERELVAEVQRPVALTLG